MVAEQQQQQTTMSSDMVRTKRYMHTLSSNSGIDATMLTCRSSPSYVGGHGSSKAKSASRAASSSDVINHDSSIWAESAIARNFDGALL